MKISLEVGLKATNFGTDTTTVQHMVHASHCAAYKDSELDLFYIISVVPRNEGGTRWSMPDLQIQNVKSGVRWGRKVDV